MDKKAHRKQKPWKNDKLTRQITEMPIRSGLILSQHLCVRNMVCHLWANFYFTNYRHCRFAQD